MKLKELRLKTNLTQTEFGKLFNISQKTYANYETEQTEAPYYLLINFAKYFNTSIDYLLENKTKNLIDISQTSEKKKELFQIVNSLEDKYCERVIGLIYAYVDQYKENYNKINNKPNWN